MYVTGAWKKRGPDRGKPQKRKKHERDKNIAEREG